MTQAQKAKKIDQETNKIDKMTIILIILVLVVCIVVGVSIGKLLFDLAMANA
jgi:flagellar basal body-associated protein FliL